MGSDEGEEVIHIDSGGPAPDQLLVCPIKDCERRFVRPASLQAHAYLHAGEKPFKCQVEGCVSAYARREHLIRHTKKIHEKEPGDFGCVVAGCHATFDTDLSLLQHFRRVHRVAGHSKGVLDRTAKILACHKCDELFPSCSRLKVHILSENHGYKCDQCDSVLASKTELITHTRCHKGSARRKALPQECHECHITLENWEALLDHRKTQEHQLNADREYTCKVCEVKCSSKSNYTSHLKTHEEERIVYRCSYEGCDRFYYYNKNLQVHVKSSHKSDLSFTCDVCNQVLSTKQKLTHHSKVMHGGPNGEPVIKPKPARKRRFNRERILDALSRSTGAESELNLLKRGPKPKNS